MTSPTDPLDRVLGGRYRLRSSLGGGREAQVFLGEDLTLERAVAVKVLRTDLVADPERLVRFREEAKGVAALNHPNVMRVYDWGEDDGMPYLVLEYLQGGSLKSVLERVGTLSVPQVVAIGAEAAHGLAYAHSRGVLHRDIKPANILFDEDGRVRVTDFEVAHEHVDVFASDEASLTADDMAYAAPEEALGIELDGRSDVYALALVLYEALTGSVPFTGASPVSALMARVGVPLPHHPALGQLDSVLARAAAPEREARLDAAGFADRLDALASSLEAPSSLPFLGVSAAASATTIGFRPPSPDQLTEAVPVSAPTVALATATAASSIDPLGGAHGPGSSTPVPNKTSKKWWWIALVILLVAAIAGGAFWFFVLKKHNDQATVPNLVGQTQAAATVAAATDHFRIATGTGAPSTTIAQGLVVSQVPAAGTIGSTSSPITVSISLGPPAVTVPTVANLSCEAAKVALTGAHLIGTCPTSAAVFSATVPAGLVVNAVYNSKANPLTAPYGATLTLAVSSGPPPKNVPQVSGSLAQATATLQSAGFAVQSATEYSATIPSGQVTRTVPIAGSPLAKGATVTVYVSQGPAPVAVPNVVGLSSSAAISALNKAGLSADVVSGPPTGTVQSCDPAAGTTVPRGTAVALVLG